MLCEERREVDVQQLVAVQREARAGLAAPRRGEAQAAAAAERLRLADGVDLGSETGERVHERLLLAGAAGDDHARDARGDEPRDAVLGEREPRDGHERLRETLCRLAEPLRLAAREEQRLHQTRSSGSRCASGSAGDACFGRPIPS